MEPDNPLNNPTPTAPPPPSPISSADDSLLPDPSGMNLNSPGDKKKKRNPMMIAIIAAVAIIILLIIVVVVVATSNSSKDKTEEKSQYQSGYDAGVKDQKAASDKAFIEQTGKDFRVYKAPSEFGSFEIPVPKTWSLSLAPKASEGTITGLSDPDFVDTTVKTHVFIFDQKKGDYDKVVNDFNETAKKSGGALVGSDATVSGVSGRRYKGMVDAKTKAKAEFVVIPLREKYIIFRTDDPDKYSETFNNILNNIKLNP